jgi:hypothetical protein
MRTSTVLHNAPDGGPMQPYKHGTQRPPHRRSNVCSLCRYAGQCHVNHSLLTMTKQQSRMCDIASTQILTGDINNPHKALHKQRTQGK